MRPRTAVFLILAIAGFGAMAALGLGYGGGAESGSLTEVWVSDTSRSTFGNHHAPVAGRVGSGALVFAPVSGQSGSNQCALTALSGSSGSTVWQYQIPPDYCTIHSVADPTLADFTGDGVPEVIGATTEQMVIGLDPQSGEERFRFNLTAYGYTRPVVTDLTGDGAPELIVVDVKGTVFVYRPDGSTVWMNELTASTWGQPVVADFDGDGEREVVVGLGGVGDVYMFGYNGEVEWHRSATVPGSVIWMTTGHLDSDPAIEVIVATTEGEIATLDGETGETQWTQDLGAFAAVRAVGDGDNDGDAEVYAVARDGKARSLRGQDGEVRWVTTLTSEEVQMTPPPALGDLDDDGDLELVTVTNDGIIAVVDPVSGEIRASYEREVPVFTYPVLEDVTGDSMKEIIVMYGDGRVITLSYSGP